MTSLNAIRNRAGQFEDLELRAFAVDPSWYERHWYDHEAAPRRRPTLAQRSSAGLALLSLLIVSAAVWI